MTGSDIICPNFREFLSWNTQLNRVHIKALTMESEHNFPVPEGAVVPVSCGHLTGKLHHSKFLCPGIHMECIEVDGDFVTPKIFSVMGDKERLKDWKNAVRINGMSVRRLMESGQLDFYSHKDQCSGRCMGKPSVKGKNEGKNDLPTQVHANLNENYSLSLSAASLGLASKSIMSNKILLPKSFNGGTPRTLAVSFPGTAVTTTLVPVTSRNITTSQAVFPQAIPVITAMNGQLSVQNSGQLTLQNTGQFNVQNSGLFLENLEPTEFDTTPLEDGGRGDTHGNGYAQGEDIKPSAEILERIRAEIEEPEMNAEEAEQFWKGIFDVGLLDEFFRHAKAALDVLKTEIVKKNVRMQDAQKISRIVHELGITSKLKIRLSLHKQEAEQQNERLQWEIEELKRKMVETEQRQLHLKRKSDAFDHLLGMSSNNKRLALNPEFGAQDSEQE